MRKNGRQVFDSLDELIDYVKNNPERTSRKTAYKVTINTQEKWILSGNSDQALAGVCRNIDVVEIEVVPITSFLSNV